MDELEMMCCAMYARWVTRSRAPAETLRHARRVARVLSRRDDSLATRELCTRASNLAERWVRRLGVGGDCYDRAVAATWWLAWRGVRVEIVIGVRKGESGEIEGHAWIEDREGLIFLMEEGAGYREVARG